MIINSLRLLTFIILFAIIIIKEIPLKNTLKDAIIQLYIAIFCIAILIIIDNISGFILTLGILILYFRIYSDEIKKKNELNKEDLNKKSSSTDNNINNIEEHKDNIHHSDTKCNKCSIDIPKKKNIFNNQDIIHTHGNNEDNFVPYISEEHLLAAQTNIIDIDNYNLNIENTDFNNLDIKKGPLYKIQGLPDEQIVSVSPKDNNPNNEISDKNNDIEIKHIRGYDVNNEYLGKLSYDILQ
jgi:Ca2+/Na+ antiporter